MNTLYIAVFAALASFAAAAPSGLGGAVIAGPSGVVTGHGAIGPVGHGLGWGGLGGWGGWGHGVGIVHGVGVVGAGHHGAVIAGPHTAPAVVAGPSGHIAADGLWGPTHHIGHGHWW